MVPGLSEEVLKQAVAALSRSGDDALTKAAAQGLPDRDQVVDWIGRIQRLLLAERDRSALRSEIPQLAERLLGLLRAVGLPEGVRAEAVAERFLLRLAAVRALLAQDVEAA